MSDELKRKFGVNEVPLDTTTFNEVLCSECGMAYGHHCGTDCPKAEPALVEQPTVSDTLSARGERYGSYPEQCRISQNIKRAMIDSPNWATLSDDKKEALEIIAVKMGRILNGDPEYADSWHDIAGYAKLVEGSLS